jgi:hypothetical protein
LVWYKLESEDDEMAEIDNAGARGRRALDAANAAFSTLPDEYLDEIARTAISVTRTTLRDAAFAALNVVSVTRKTRKQSEEPYTTAFVRDTAAAV